MFEAIPDASRPTLTGRQKLYVAIPGVLLIAGVFTASLALASHYKLALGPLDSCGKKILKCFTWKGALATGIISAYFLICLGLIVARFYIDRNL